MKTDGSPRSLRARSSLLAASLVALCGCSADQLPAGFTSNDAATDDSDAAAGADATPADLDAGRASDSSPGIVDASSGDAHSPKDSGTSLDATAAHDSGGSVDSGSDATLQDAASGDAATADASMGSGGQDATPIDEDASLPATLGAWSFNEGTGTSSADLSGNGHPAVLAGSATWGANGKEGSGLALDGTTGYADVGVTLIDTTKSYSVAAWVSLTVVSAWEIALSEDDVTGSLFGLKLRGDATNEFDFDIETSDATNPGFVVAQSTSTAAATTWTHLAGVYDATGQGAMKIYVNGALQANAAVGQTPLAATGHFVIGRGLYNGVTGSFLDGMIDEVAVYGSALSDAQVATLYAAQK